MLQQPLRAGRHSVYVFNEMILKWQALYRAFKSIFSYSFGNLHFSPADHGYGNQQALAAPVP